MREKYIDEKVGFYFIFGVYKDADGAELVDISDGQRDVFTGISLEAARKIVSAQDEFRSHLYEILGC